MFRYRWLCEQAREMGLDDDEWEDMSDDDEEDISDDQPSVEVEMEMDEAMDEVIPISEAECIIDGINQKMIQLKECLFCGIKSKTDQDSIKHMEDNHGFFIPRSVVTLNELREGYP